MMHFISRTVAVCGPLARVCLLFACISSASIASAQPAPQTTASGTVNYLVDTQNLTGYAQVIAEYDAGATAPLRVYAYGSDLISQRDSQNGTHYYGYDGHGSVRLLSNEDGSEETHYDYDAFGVLISQGSSTVENNYLYAGEQWDPDLGMYYLLARYLEAGTGRFWTMDDFEGSQEQPSFLHKYLYAHADPVNNTDPSGNETLTTTLASTAIRSGLVSMSIGAPFRAYRAAQQFRTGVDFSTIAYDASIGVLTDGAIRAALPGLFNVVGRGISALRASQAFVRAADTVWNMGAFACGWAIESRILGGTRRLVPNFPVIDDLVNGVDTSIKSIDLTAATYRSAANLSRQLKEYAVTLSRFNGASASYAGQVSRVTANQIEQRVLLVAVEDGASTVAQMLVIIEFVAEAKLLWPNIKVLVGPVP